MWQKDWNLGSRGTSEEQVPVHMKAFLCVFRVEFICLGHWGAPTPGGSSKAVGGSLPWGRAGLKAECRQFMILHMWVRERIWSTTV